MEQSKGLQNGIFKSVVFLEVMNLYDGIIIDEKWGRFSKFWDILGLEYMNYV